jgi:hypothetical protein
MSRIITTGNKFQLFGMWSVDYSGSTNEWVSGVYQHKEDGGELHLFVESDKYLDMFDAGMTSIHGATDCGHCTLINCFCKSINHGKIGTLNDFHVNGVFLGDHLRSHDNNRFFKCSFTFENFSKWFKVDERNSIKHNESGMTLSIAMGNYIWMDVDVLDDVNIKIVESSIFRYGKRRASLDPQVRIEIESSNPKSYDFFSDIVCKIQGLFLIFVGVSMMPTDISLYDSDGEYEISPPRMMYAPDADIGRSVVFFTGKDDLRTAFVNFFEKSFAIDGIISKAREVFSGRTIYIENTFYRIIQSIEMLEREFYKGAYCNDDEFLTIKENMKDAISSIKNEKIKNKFLSQLEHGNEFSLRDKAAKLIEKVISNTSYGKIKDYKNYIRDAVEMRNELTHHSKPAQRSYTIDKYIDVASFFKKIMWAILLHELGFSWELIERRVLKNPLFTRI